MSLTKNTFCKLVCIKRTKLNGFLTLLFLPLLAATNHNQTSSVWRPIVDPRTVHSKIVDSDIDEQEDAFEGGVVLSKLLETGRWIVEQNGVSHELMLKFRSVISLLSHLYFRPPFLMILTILKINSPQIWMSDSLFSHPREICSLIHHYSIISITLSEHLEDYWTKIKLTFS